VSNFSVSGGGRGSPLKGYTEDGGYRGWGRLSLKKIYRTLSTIYIYIYIWNCLSNVSLIFKILLKNILNKVSLNKVVTKN